jgi:geranylgeranyl diphosphate synthase type II
VARTFVIRLRKASGVRSEKTPSSGGNRSVRRHDIITAAAEVLAVFYQPTQPRVASGRRHRTDGRDIEARWSLGPLMFDMAGLVTARLEPLLRPPNRFEKGHDDEQDILAFGTVASAGPMARRKLWLHNLDDAGREPVELVVRLVGWPADEGKRPRLTVDSPSLPPPSPGSSHPIVLALDVPESAVPGEYTWSLTAFGLVDHVLVTAEIVEQDSDEVSAASQRSPDDARLAAINRRMAAYRAVVRTEMARFLPAAEPKAYLYDLMRDYPTRPGKLIRSSLCLAAGEAYGGSIDDVLGVAVALELMHNAFLVHDDVEDESLLRRGAPTLSSIHGVALSVNAGDALAMAALRPLHDAINELGPLIGRRVWSEFDLMMARTLEGQAMELGWQRDGRTNIGVADYLRMVTLKTASYTTVFPLCVGALIASGGSADLRGLTTGGVLLGCAFQIIDDVLSLSPTRGYGKDALGDLYEGKRSFPIIRLLNHASADDRRRIEGFLRLPRVERDDLAVRAILQRVRKSGSLDGARSDALILADQGITAVTAALKARGSSPAQTFLLGLCRHLVTRTE